jgi:hypothetical protein
MGKGASNSMENMPPALLLGYIKVSDLLESNCLENDTGTYWILTLSRRARHLSRAALVRSALP